MAELRLLVALTILAMICIGGPFLTIYMVRKLFKPRAAGVSPEPKEPQ